MGWIGLAQANPEPPDLLHEIPILEGVKRRSPLHRIALSHISMAAGAKLLIRLTPLLWITRHGAHRTFHGKRSDVHGQLGKQPVIQLQRFPVHLGHESVVIPARGVVFSAIAQSLPELGDLLQDIPIRQPRDRRCFGLFNAFPVLSVAAGAFIAPEVDGVGIGPSLGTAQ